MQIWANLIPILTLPKVGFLDNSLKYYSSLHKSGSVVGQYLLPHCLHDRHGSFIVKKMNKTKIDLSRTERTSGSRAVTRSLLR